VHAVSSFRRRLRDIQKRWREGAQRWMFGSHDSSKLKPGVGRQATTERASRIHNTLADAWMVNQATRWRNRAVFPDESEHLMALERLIRAWLRCRWRTRANRSDFRPLMIAPLVPAPCSSLPRRARVSDSGRRRRTTTRRSSHAGWRNPPKTDSRSRCHA
jgi:hypothetical protein